MAFSSAAAATLLSLCAALFWNNGHGALAFQPPPLARPLPALPSTLAAAAAARRGPPTTTTTTTALRASHRFFDFDFDAGDDNDGFSALGSALGELTSALGGVAGAGAGAGLRAGTPVFVGDLGRMGVVVGREVDGQYLVQVNSRGAASVVRGRLEWGGWRVLFIIIQPK